MSKYVMNWDGKKVTAQPAPGSYLRIHAQVGDFITFQGDDAHHVHFESSPFNDNGDPEDIEFGVEMEVVSGAGESHEFWITKVRQAVVAGATSGDNGILMDAPQGQIDIDG